MSKLNRFNWIAPGYDKLVKLVFGETLHEAQLYFVNEIGSSDHVLILGGGSGEFLSSLLKARPLIHVTYIEASSEMLAMAKAKMDGIANVTFVHGTEDEIPPQQFDVVITNFVLDVFQQNQVESFVAVVKNILKANGKWLVTDFENTSKLSHRILLRLMYLFFKISGSIDARRLPMWRSAFNKAGLKLKKQQFFRNGFVSTGVFSKQNRFD